MGEICVPTRGTLSTLLIARSGLGLVGHAANEAPLSNFDNCARDNVSFGYSDCYSVCYSVGQGVNGSAPIYVSPAPPRPILLLLLCIQM